MVLATFSRRGAYECLELLRCSTSAASASSFAFSLPSISPILDSWNYRLADNSGTIFPMPTILITGFGHFPGAPYNPTMKLERTLARLRRPALVETRIVAHIFKTSYAAVDRDLPDLIARHQPDALLMFGQHGRAKAIRIETRARNALVLLSVAC